MNFDKNTRVLAFMNAFSQGKSGGDTAFIQIFREFEIKNLTVATSLLGQELCELSNLSAKFVITTHERTFGNVYYHYFWRIVNGIFKTWNLKNTDLIYSSSDSLPDVLPALLLKAKNKNVKWVVKRYHNITKTRVVSYLFQRLSIFLVKKADLVIQTGEFGFDKKMIDKIFPSKTKSDAIFVGRLHVSKGIFELLEIWQKTVSVLPKAKLTIVGDGDKKTVSDFKQKICEFHLEKNITLTGFLSEKEKIARIKSSKLFLFPSREEAFGLVLGEAMLCKTPVVMYLLPDLKWCETLVFKTPCFEKEYFSKVITELLRNEKKRIKYVKRAYEQVKNLTWEKAAEREKELIMKI